MTRHLYSFHSVLRPAILLLLLTLPCTILRSQENVDPYKAGSPADSLTLVQADWHWVDLGGGAQAGWASVEMFSSVQNIAIIRYPMRRFHTELLEEDGKNAKATSETAMAHGAAMAINGSYFNMRELTPTTFVKDEGKVLSESSSSENFRLNALLLMRGKRKSKVKIVGSTPSEDLTLSRRSREALSSGPILMLGGNTIIDESDKSNFYIGRHPRSAVGYTLKGHSPSGTLSYGESKAPSGKIVYLIVIDGRFPAQADGATIPETAFICKVLGLHDAMNLDGGGSSTLWDKDYGVLNHPYDNHRFDHSGERKVPNVIAVYPR